MARSARKQILELYRQAQEHIDRLDELLADMSIRSEGRQPMIDQYGPILIEAHKNLRLIWQSLRDFL